MDDHLEEPRQDAALPRRRGGERRNESTFWISVVVATLVILVTRFIVADLTEEREPKPRKPDSRTMNISEAMVPFWRGSQTIFHDDTGSEPWFDSAEANSRTIATMMETVPLSFDTDPKGDDYILIPRIETRIKEREAHLAKAETAFEYFFAAREKLLHRLLMSRLLWHWYADGGQGIKYLVHLARQKESEDVTHSEEKYNNVAGPAKRIVIDTVQTYRSLWERNDTGIFMEKNLAKMKEHLSKALAAEVQVIKHLKKKSSKGHMWDVRQDGIVMHQLLARASSLENAYKDVKVGLEQMRLSWMGSEKSNYIPRTSQEAAFAWARGVEDLLKNWGALLLNSHLGTLFATRREEFKNVKDIRKFDFDTSWNQWKQRNCGGTSCYDTDNSYRRVARLLNSYIPPIAHRAKDELKFTKIQRRGVYEKACCQDGIVALLLKYGPVTTIESKAKSKDKS
ncbi:hypothetical protein F4781DRAFT_19927 [Annulohypoxylon bovei var. microspora]|nr:hypothetical protein F4781DRAFT_19927 [Annulohypoxylon bovei var. microspora]